MNKILPLLLLSTINLPCFAKECDFIKYNSCKSCNSLYSFSVGSKEACSFLCPNREVNYFGSGSGVLQINCALKKCPDTAPYQSKDGSCYKTKEEADNTDIWEENEEENFDSEDEDILYPTIKKDCSEKNQFKRWDGRCFSCDSQKTIRVETHCNIENDCNDICPNRTIIKSVGGNVPSVPNCPKEKPMMDDEGICYSCSLPIPIGVTWNKDFCLRFCPNERHLEGNFCILNTKREE